MSIAAHRALVLRETLISMAINMAISAGFFLAVFGLGGTVSSRLLALDCLPQSFMVGLMGALMPALMVRRRLVQAPDPGRMPVIRRAVGAALLMLLSVGGGLAALAFAAAPVLTPGGLALGAKVSLGGLMAAIVTPWAVVCALPSEYEVLA